MIFTKYRKTTIALCLCAIALSAVEFYNFQKYGYAQASEAFCIDFDVFWANRPNSSYCREYENGKRVSYSYNAQGFRRENTEDQISLNKKDGCKRIIALGDSTTNGHGVAFEAIYAERLNQTFGDGVEVFSAAVPGYSSVQCRIQFEKKILQYDPDLITVAVNYNDRRSIYTRSLADAESYFYYTSRLRWIAESLACRIAFVNGFMQYKIQSLEERLKQHPPSLADLVCRVPLTTFSKNLERLCATAKERNVKVVLIGLGDSIDLFDGIVAYRNARTFDEKVEFLLKERDDESFYTYGLATLLLANLLKKEGVKDTGLDPNQLLRSYQTVISALGGFVIKPGWTYREAIKKTANKMGVPYFNFAAYIRTLDEIQNGTTKIYIKDDAVHLNSKGHRLLADALYPILEKTLTND